MLFLSVNAEPHIVYLRFNGEVVQEIKDYTKTHPYLIGQIRIDKNTLDFPDVHLGEHPVMHVGVVNLSDRPYEPVLMHLPPYLDMEVKPNVLQKGEKGIITLTLNPEKLTDLGLTQASVYLSRFAGDKVTDESEIPVSAILLPDFSNLSETQKNNPPQIQLSTTQLEFLSLKPDQKKTQHVEITNVGKSDLVIQDMQVFNPALGVNLKKTTLKPGESTKMKITVYAELLPQVKGTPRVLMITNDPEKPSITIRVKAALREQKEK